jgi:uncharacterized protein (TIGR02147 family)
MSIFEFSDYRLYLKSRIRAFPKKGRGKLLELAHALGAHPSVLSQIFSGSRNFTEEHSLEVCEFLGLSSAESTYFRLMVRLADASTRKLKTVLQAELNEARQKATVLSKRVQPVRALTTAETALFYSSWLYSACRLFCSTSPGGRTPEEVAVRFGVSRRRALEILEFLLQHGLCIFESDHYKMGPQSTWVEQGSPFLIKHHTNWRLKCLQYAEEIKPEELQFTGVISISRGDFKKVREKLAHFLQEFSETVRESPAEELACLNIDFLRVRG